VSTVTFADSDVARVISVPIVADAAPEDDKTVNLTLSGRAARRWGPKPVVLTIVDDDRPLAPPISSRSAARSASSGSGLVLSNLGEDLPPAAAPSTSRNAERHSVRRGWPQPSDPAQICAVTNRPERSPTPT
jgi:hypothetical protein